MMMKVEALTGISRLKLNQVDDVRDASHTPGALSPRLLIRGS